MVKRHTNKRLIAIACGPHCPPVRGLSAGRHRVNTGAPLCDQAMMPNGNPNHPPHPSSHHVDHVVEWIPVMQVHSHPPLPPPSAFAPQRRASAVLGGRRERAAEAPPRGRRLAQVVASPLAVVRHLDLGEAGTHGGQCVEQPSWLTVTVSPTNVAAVTTVGAMPLNRRRLHLSLSPREVAVKVSFSGWAICPPA